MTHPRSRGPRAFLPALQPAWLLAGLVVLVPAVTPAQPVPSLAQAGSSYTLSVPYLEYGSGSSRQAFSATLRSSTLTRFTLDAAASGSTPLLASSSNPARVEALGTGFRLSLPYLEYASGGVTRAYSVSLASTDLASFTVELDSVRELALQPAAPTGVQLAAVGVQTVGSLSFGSSTQLQVSWDAPGSGVDHYEITATESLMNTRVRATAAATARSTTLAGLKASTAYAVQVVACGDSACTRAGPAAVVSATTPAEYWQLQGSGNSVATLLQPVADGNARLSATRFGPEAGAVANTVQLYYGPKGVSGLSVAASGMVSAASKASYLSFTSLAASSGLRSPASAASGIKSVMTGQGVPLSAALGARVRLFFESNDADGKTRIYSVDSVDGYLGRDFNQSLAATTCSTSADYQAGGPCAATLAIGVEGDGANANARFNAARQQKLAYPTQTDWRWDGAAGSFMVFTVDAIAGCSTASHNHAYAVWNGSRFVVQYAADGCPKLFRSAQAALPMHIGGARYKMYFGDPSLSTGRLTGSQLPFVGPKKLVYADGASTGPEATVEFEDWERVDTARNVHFLWPNGEPLNDRAEGYIDDFHFLAPTGSLDLQVLYLSITDGTVLPFAAAAVLLNP
ncbi:MAG: fibronectin type III domain-containing protein [Burkholderiales bacterium]|nr:fibronectin type III domain-containing protein [Burkholderiales bacterium]